MYAKQKCPDCDHVPHCQAGWEIHRRVHTDERPFACSFCDQRFKQSGGLNRHVAAIHENKKLFECTHVGCDFVSARKHGIAVHEQQVHRHVRSFGCTFPGCEYRAKVLSNMTLHTTQVHQKIRNHVCHVCGHRCSLKCILRKHMRKHAKDGHDVEDCPHCVDLKRDARLSEAVAGAHDRKKRRLNSSGQQEQQDYWETVLCTSDLSDRWR